MDEAYLKKKLVAALEAEMAGAVVIRHEDQFTAGIPDLSVTWALTTTWIEVKYDRPKARAKVSALQARMLRRLNYHGSAILLTYRELPDGTRTTEIERGGQLELNGQGFAFADVARYVKGLHWALCGTLEENVEVTNAV